jgi:hypothetical protein
MWVDTARTCAAVAQEDGVKDARVAIDVHGDVFGRTTVKLANIGGIGYEEIRLLRG